MNLGTTYLGMRLPHPLIVGAGPLTDDIDVARALEDQGAAAVVLRSMFEEEITGEQMSAFFSSETYGESFPRPPVTLRIQRRPLDPMSISSTCAE